MIKREKARIMIDKRIGKRVKTRREELGFTQAELAEKVGVGVNYISTLERGVSFPRWDHLIKVLNGLQTSADSIFCDVLDYSGGYRESLLSEELNKIPPEAKSNILEVVELLISQAKNAK